MALLVLEGRLRSIDNLIDAVKRVAKACNRSAHMGRMGLAGDQRDKLMCDTTDLLQAWLPVLNPPPPPARRGSRTKTVSGCRSPVAANGSPHGTDGTAPRDPPDSH